MNFRYITHLETLAVLSHLHKLQPSTWTGGDEINDAGAGPSLLLRGHENATAENWPDDLPVIELPELEKWKSMQALLSRARKAVMQDHDALTVKVGLAPLLSGRMARAKVSRLDAGSTVFWHVDEGHYHSKTARFHLPLVTNPGCTLYSGNEQVHLPVGALWHVNNHAMHSEANWGMGYRVHLIFDMRVVEAPAAEE